MLLGKHVAWTRRLTSPDISKVYTCIFWPVKSLYKLISLKLMVKFINLC